MSSREVRGRTVEQAVAAGLAEMRLEPGQVKVEVIDPGSRGFLGLGAKEALVRLTPQLSRAQWARRFLEDVIGAAGLKATVATSEDEDVLRATVDGSDLGSLIGHRGRTLDALQCLLGVAVGRLAAGSLRVALDVNGYRKQREEALTLLARRTADLVRRTGRSVALEAMPAHERRVVHLALREMKDVCTQSEGEEPYRRVVVMARRDAQPSG